MKLENVVLHTNGHGFWSRRAAAVRVNSAQLEGSELQVYFDLNDWDPKWHGLIYTDPQWQDQLRIALLAHGFSQPAVMQVEYSEQGMQGDDYVSMDAGPLFRAEWQRRK